MTKIFDDFDLDIQKVRGVQPLDASCGDSNLQCSSGGGGPDTTVTWTSTQEC